MYEPIDADVIIVGAGVAGLTAAYWLHLKEPTLSVIILEATERIGGRTLSVPLLTNRGKDVTYLDLGAQWVCKEQNYLFDLLECLGIRYQATNKQGRIITHYQCLYTSERHAKGHYSFLNTSEKFQFAKYIIKVEALCRKIKFDESSKYVEELNKKSLEQFINETVSSCAVRAIINHMVMISCGVVPHQISALFYIFFCISTRGICHQLPTEDRKLLELRVKGGVQTIANRIAEEIGRDSIIQDEFVRAISFNSRYVEVVSKHATYRSYTAIVAVPPKAILNIKFSPNLHENHVEAIMGTCTSTVTNFVATFEREFWKDLNLSGECYFFDKTRARGPIDYCANISTTSKVALAGRILQAKVTNFRFPIYRSEVLHQLAYYFGESALYPIDYQERSWTNQTCQMVGWNVGNKNFIKHIAQDYDRLFFAGAETTPEWYGYVAGAINSGMKAALEVLSLLRPAVLKPSDIELIRASKRRNQLIPLRSYYAETLYAAAENWKLILSVCLLFLIGLWRLRLRFFPSSQ